MPIFNIVFSLYNGKKYKHTRPLDINFLGYLNNTNIQSLTSTEPLPTIYLFWHVPKVIFCMCSLLIYIFSSNEVKRSHLWQVFWHLLCSSIQRDTTKQRSTRSTLELSSSRPAVSQWTELVGQEAFKALFETTFLKIQGLAQLQPWNSPACRLVAIILKTLINLFRCVYLRVFQSGLPK